MQFTDLFYSTCAVSSETAADFKIEQIYGADVAPKYFSEWLDLNPDYKQIIGKDCEAVIRAFSQDEGYFPAFKAQMNVLIQKLKSWCIECKIAITSYDHQLKAQVDAWQVFYEHIFPTPIDAGLPASVAVQLFSLGKRQLEAIYLKCKQHSSKARIEAMAAFIKDNRLTFCRSGCVIGIQRLYEAIHDESWNSKILKIRRDVLEYLAQQCIRKNGLQIEEGMHIHAIVQLTNSVAPLYRVPCINDIHTTSKITTAILKSYSADVSSRYAFYVIDSITEELLASVKCIRDYRGLIDFEKNFDFLGKDDCFLLNEMFADPDKFCLKNDQELRFILRCSLIYRLWTQGLLSGCVEFKTPHRADVQIYLVRSEPLLSWVCIKKSSEIYRSQLITKSDTTTYKIDNSVASIVVAAVFGMDLNCLQNALLVCDASADQQIASFRQNNKCLLTLILERQSYDMLLAICEHGYTVTCSLGFWKAASQWLNNNDWLAFCTLIYFINGGQLVIPEPTSEDVKIIMGVLHKLPQWSEHITTFLKTRIKKYLSQDQLELLHKVLFDAVAARQSSIACDLIDLGVPFYSKSSSGASSCLSVAVFAGLKEVISSLLLAGADPLEEVEIDGRTVTPLQLSIEKESECAPLMLSFINVSERSLDLELIYAQIEDCPSPYMGQLINARLDAVEVRRRNPSLILPAERLAAALHRSKTVPAAKMYVDKKGAFITDEKEECCACVIS